MVTRIPWRAWYGDTQLELAFPESWQVQEARMLDAPGLTSEAIRADVINPIGSVRLRELAARANKVAVVVEDMTRPTPTSLLMPIVLSELESAGLLPGQIKVIVGLGTHAPMMHDALLKKLGEGVVGRYSVCQHHPYRNLDYIGTTPMGTPVYLNHFFVEADLRVAVGGIVPHPQAGFGGGAKTVSVGVAGATTLEAHHLRAWPDEAELIGRVEENSYREDLEEMARMAGLHFIVNGVVNSERMLAGVFAGDPEKAHRAGVGFARRIYGTELAPPSDIVILNAYPKDTDLVQSINALNAVGVALGRAVKPGGSAVIATASPEGAGIHYLVGVGFGWSENYDLVRKFQGVKTVIFSPNLFVPEIRHEYPEGIDIISSWDAVIESLLRLHGRTASVTVYPCASMQIPIGE